MQEGMTTRLSVVPLVATLLLFPIQAFAVVATEIKPQDVYQASYCKTFVDGAVSARTEQIAQKAVTIIHLHADDLIAGGDNLAFAPLGEAAARSDLIQALGLREKSEESVQQSISLASKVEECAAHLSELVDAYRMNSCGYGTNRNYSEELFAVEVEEEKGLLDRLLMWLE